MKPIPDARPWDRSDRLLGEGPDVVLVRPPTSADTNMVVRAVGEGDFVISAYVSNVRVPLLSETAPFQGRLLLPAGTSLVEVEARDGWSIIPD